MIDAANCDSTVHCIITSAMAMLRSVKPISIDSASGPGAVFLPAKNEPVHVFEYDPYYYWFRIIIRNNQPEPRKLMLLMAPVGIYDARLYQKTGAAWSAVAWAGLHYRFEDRSYQFTHHVFPFSLAATTTDTLYLQIDASNVYKTFGFALLKPRQLKLFENKIYFVFGIITGLLILFFFINVSLFFALKDNLHLWYALYIVLLVLIVLKNDHLDQQFLGLDTETAFRLTPYMTIGALAIAVLMQVSQHFLKPVLKKPLNYATNILKINIILSAVVHAIVFKTSGNYMLEAVVFSWTKYSTLLGICMIITNCIYSMREMKTAAFILCGSIVFLIGSVQRLFFASTLSFLFPPTTFHIGIIVETFVITLGLIYRYRADRKKQRQAREKDAEEQRKRDEELKQLITQDFSDQIHDDLQHSLVVANLNLHTIDLSDAEKGQDNIARTKKLISEGISDLRHLSRALNNEQADSYSLQKKIENLCSDIRKAGMIAVTLTISDKPEEIAAAKQIILLRAIKGILTNALKHAKASCIDIALMFTRGHLLLTIRDNGTGFELTDAVRKSNGLNNIKTRIRLLKGSCMIQSAPGQGTTVEIDLPLDS